MLLIPRIIDVSSIFVHSLFTDIALAQVPKKNLGRHLTDPEWRLRNYHDIFLRLLTHVNSCESRPFTHILLMTHFRQFEIRLPCCRRVYVTPVMELRRTGIAHGTDSQTLVIRGICLGRSLKLSNDIRECHHRSGG